ncbi:MAG: hypothetical protein MUF54_02455, partial [Polyangiaceae bacterium]|nr:hypothetical protein [Polyangiaceae bacterium]
MNASVNPSPAVPATPASSSAKAAGYPKPGLICLYGRERDEATQRDRCLSPEELQPPRLVIVNSRPLAEQLGMLEQAQALDAGLADGAV